MPKSSKYIVCICGSRDITNINLDLFLDPNHIGCIVEGAAKGVDTLAKQWAKRNKIEFVEYPAQWRIYGKKAGIIRNKEMIDFCDIVVAFWNGYSKGTLNSIQYAKEMKIPCFIHLIQSLD